MASRYRIVVNGVLVDVTKKIFDSWTGRRYKDDSEYHGPCYLLGVQPRVVSTAARVCPCVTCQRNVKFKG